MLYRRFLSVITCCAFLCAPLSAYANNCNSDIYRRHNPDKCTNHKSSYGTTIIAAGGAAALIGGAVALISGGSSSSGGNTAPAVATTTVTHTTNRDSYQEVGNDIDFSRVATMTKQTNYVRNAVQYDDIRLGYSLARGFTGKNSTIAVFDSATTTWHGKNVAAIASDQVAPDAAIKSYEVAYKSGDFKPFYEIGNIINSATDAQIYNFSWSASNAYANQVHSRAQIEQMTDKNFIAALTNAATNHDAILVWAAGNEFHSQSSALSAMPRVIPELNGHFVNVVAWDSETESLADFSNACGVTKDYCITAPGAGLKTPESSISLNGTSFAAPIVSAAIAVIREAFPYMKSGEITNLLFATARDIGATGVDEVYGHGMLDMERATRPVGAQTIPMANGTSASMQPARVSGTIGEQIKSADIKFSFVDSFGRAFETRLNDNISVKNRGLGFERLREGDTTSVKIDNINIGFKQTDMLSATGFLQTDTQTMLSFVGYNDEIRIGNASIFYNTSVGVMNPKASTESMVSGFSSLYTASAKIGAKYNDWSFSVGTPDTIVSGNMYLNASNGRARDGRYLFKTHQIDMAATPSVEYTMSYKFMSAGFVDNPTGTDEIYVLAKTKFQF